MHNVHSILHLDLQLNYKTCAYSDQWTILHGLSLAI